MFSSRHWGRPLASICLAIVFGSLLVGLAHSQTNSVPSGSQLEGGTAALIFTVDTSPYDDINLRKALVHALDKNALLASLASAGFNDPVVLSNSIFPPGIQGHRTGLQGPEFNVELAQNLLDQSSYSDPLSQPPLILSYPVTGDFPNEDVADFLADVWGDSLGIGVAFSVFDIATFVNELIAHDIDGIIEIVELPIDYSDPQEFLEDWFKTDGVFNYMRYSNSAVDSLIETAATESEPAIKAALYNEIEDAVLDDAVWIPLWFRTSGDGPPTSTLAPTPTPVSVDPPPASLTGDANGDGTVNAIDSAVLLQFIAGLAPSLSNPGAADANEDGTLNAVDSTLILQFVAGLISSLPP